jgi:hypothetical protein
LPRFPVAFRLPAFASQVLRPSLRDWAFLAVGLPATSPCPDFPSGSHVPHARDATGVGASCISGAAVLIRPTKNPRPAPAASQRPAPTRRLIHHRRGSRITRHQRRFTRFTRPVCPLPVTLGWNRGPSAFPQSFAPRRCQRRTLRVGPGHRAQARDYASGIGRSSNLRVHSLPATSCRSFFFVSTLMMGSPAAVNAARCTAI